MDKQLEVTVALRALTCCCKCVWSDWWCLGVMVVCLLIESTSKVRELGKNEKNNFKLHNYLQG